jgi:hypothetical protein
MLVLEFIRNRLIIGVVSLELSTNGMIQGISRVVSSLIPDTVAYR